MPRCPDGPGSFAFATTSLANPAGDVLDTRLRAVFARQEEATRWSHHACPINIKGKGSDAETPPSDLCTGDVCSGSENVGSATKIPEGAEHFSPDQ